MRHRVIDLREEIDVPDDGIVSRAIHDDDSARVVLFSFAAGQQLSDHTAAVPITLVIVDGEAEVTIDGTAHEGQRGAWVHLPANVPHSIVARTPATILLTLLKSCS